jgi:hypothetical protein
MQKSVPWGLVDFPEQWTETRSAIDRVQFFGMTMLTDQQDKLKEMAALFSESDIKATFEIGGLLDWHADEQDLSAERSFEEDLAMLNHWRDAGGTIDRVHLDGPIRRMVYPFGVEESYHTFDTAIAELVQLINLWHAEGVEVFLLTNFPNWGWKGESAYVNQRFTPFELGYGDYYDVYMYLMAELEKNGGYLDGVIVDSPLDFSNKEIQSNNDLSHIDFFERILDLENLVQESGMKFGLIYNSVFGMRGSNRDFYFDVMDYIEIYHDYGGRPDIYNIVSWMQFPLVFLPEGTPHTMTNLALNASFYIDSIRSEQVDSTLSR